MEIPSRIFSKFNVAHLQADFNGASDKGLVFTHFFILILEPFRFVGQTLSGGKRYLLIYIIAKSKGTGTSLEIHTYSDDMILSSLALDLAKQSLL